MASETEKQYDREKDKRTLCRADYCFEKRQPFHFVCFRCWLKVPRWLRGEIFEAWVTKRTDHCTKLVVSALNHLHLTHKAG